MSFKSAPAMSEHKDPKKTPLVAQRLLLLQEMFESTGRGASVRMAQSLGITPHSLVIAPASAPQPAASAWPGPPHGRASPRVAQPAATLAARSLPESVER